MHKLNFTLILVIIFSSLSISISAQNTIGLSTGNFGGVSSLWFNPSGIVDSRHKFEINLVSFNSYLDNNLFDVRRDAVTGRRFFKEPYNNSFTGVRNDLLSLTPVVNKDEKVNMFIENKVQFPASFMISIRKKSAIAFNLQSRIGLQGFDINRSTAQLLYNELRDSSQYGIMQDNSGFAMNYLRWQEAGFTYGTVLLNRQSHFLKGAFTAKWLMGQSGAYIQSDNVRVQFNSATQMSLQSPLIRYYRSANADVRFLGVQSFFKDVEDHGFGWDAGITYEFRGKFNKFKYVGENNEIRDRRDLNKYAFRLGLAIVDVGKFTFRKQRLTNDHSANFSNFDFSRVKANGFNEFDTAYSKQVQYVSGASPTFDIGLPAAISANIDIHLVRGFYINGALYSPLTKSGSAGNTSLRAAKWYAITPRLETRHLGLYFPVVVTPLNNRTNIGATLRIGSLFIGSGNFGSYVFNDRLSAIDVHAGVKLGITYGSPSRLSRTFQRIIKVDAATPVIPADTSIYAAYRNALDSIRRAGSSVRPEEVRAPLVNVIVNNYLAGSVPPGAPLQYRTRDSVVINNAVPLSGALPAGQKDSALLRKDAEIDYLLRRAAENELRLRQLEQKRIADSIVIANRPVSRVQATAPATSAQPATTVIQPLQGVETTRIIEVPSDNRRRTPQTVVTLQQPNDRNRRQLNRIEDQNNDLEAEIRRLRSEMTASANIQTTPAINNRGIIEVQRMLPGDTVINTITDTVRLTDTIVIREPQRVSDTIASSPVQPLSTPVRFDYDPVYFATGSSVITPAGLRDLERLVNDYKKYRFTDKVHLTGRTDSMGAAELNKRLAQRRIDAVSKYLVENGVPQQQVSFETQPEVDANPRREAEKRRVDIDIVTLQQ